jgi:two-component system repressor protein LuxO
VSDREGAASRADGGTLFLDEICELAPDLQTKLLRFIQTGTYERVGEGRSRHADIRFVAATNRDPLGAVREGRLREDLFYRLFVVPVAMPPLRDRGEDILLIARRFLEEFARAEGKEFKSLTPEVEARLMAYSWPGNVRQLQNVIRNIVVLNDGPAITVPMLPALPEPDQPNAPAPRTNGHAQPALSTDLPETAEAIIPLAEMERLYIERAIDLYNGSIQLAARKLGISPSTIYRKKEGWSS